MKKSLLIKILLIAALVFYILSAVFLWKGYDKMTNYYNSEYSTRLNKNAYVGGDAYNYIINGNYATGFFTLAVGFMITGTLCGKTGLMLKYADSNEESESTPVAVPEEPAENDSKESGIPADGVPAETEPTENE